MRLSKHFTLDEFTRSSTAKQLGDDNAPEADHRSALQVTALGMEMVRALLGGKPVRITSGYRNPAVNKAVGGVPTSAHALGYAADFAVSGITPIDVARKIADSPLTFDQLILETSRNIVHISFDPRLRREVKTQKGGPGSPVEWGIQD